MNHETRAFNPSLEGMRAVAALGVLTTHVAFQTGNVGQSLPGPVWGRFDMAVALFFALSGYLLWRPWAVASWDDLPRPSMSRYFRHRVMRIWPVYIVVVVAVLAIVPQAQTDSVVVWLANLTLTQVYVPLSLTAGLTQMWSLSVEVSFYLAMPLLGLAMRRLRPQWRLPLLVWLAVLSLGWASLASVLPIADGIEPKNWLPGHLPWFISGLVLAEIAAAPPWTWRRLRRLAERRVVMGVVALVAFGLSCTSLAGPIGLAPVSDGQFVVKMVLGAVLGFAVLGPLVFGDHRHRFLESSTMQALGRWSYGIFIWHLAVLTVVFPLFGVVPFSGSMWLVWPVTVLGTVGVSAVGYALVEEPARRLARKGPTHERVRTSQRAEA